MTEARTLDMSKATLKEVLELCAEWKANKHYGHNTVAVVDYLASRVCVVCLDKCLHITRERIGLK